MESKIHVLEKIVQNLGFTQNTSLLSGLTILRKSNSDWIDISQLLAEAKMQELIALVENTCLAQEDEPSFHFSCDEKINQTIIEGIGELHLEIIVDWLKREFKVNYHESVCEVSKIKYVHKKQSSESGQFVNINVHFEPLEKFVNEIKGRVVPKEYIPRVMRGLEECTSNGVLAGFPLVNVRTLLVNGTYHDVDSSVLAFHPLAASWERGLERQLNNLKMV